MATIKSVAFKGENLNNTNLNFQIAHNYLKYIKANSKCSNLRFCSTFGKRFYQS